MIRPTASTAAKSGPTADAVHLEEIAQRLGGRWALRGIDFRLAPGELVAVVGHNGSGKTTLLRVICTSLRPTRGTGHVLGHDLREAPDAVRGVVAMLANGGGMYEDLTAGENLTFAQKMLGMPADGVRRAEALEWAGLGRSADVRVRTFSSGMRRRLALAAVYMRRTPLLLMDEPYNSLDPAGGALVDGLLNEARVAGGAAVVVLHDLARSTVQFDRIIELRDGRITRDERCNAPLFRPSLVGVK